MSFGNSTSASVEFSNSFQSSLALNFFLASNDLNGLHLGGGFFAGGVG